MLRENQKKTVSDGITYLTQGGLKKTTSFAAGVYAINLQQEWSTTQFFNKMAMNMRLVKRLLAKIMK